MVQELLEYAATKTPPHFCFVLNHQIAIPEPDCLADFVVVFSVFTHLYHEESYTYLRDMRRVLRSGGKLMSPFWNRADIGKCLKECWRDWAKRAS